MTTRLLVDWANAAAASLLQLPPARRAVPLPEPWPEFSLRRFARTLVAPGAEPAEVRVRVEGGRVLDLLGAPTRDGAALALRDVSRHVREEESDRAFIANAAHELRGSLGGISTAVEALAAGAKDEESERERLLSGIAGEVGRLRRDVEALLVLSRAQAVPRAAPRAPGMEPVPVAPLVEEVAAGLDVRPGVGVETSCDRAVAVSADRPLLEIALRNVARNAARHATQGTISLRCRRADRDRVVLEVADDGPGIEDGARDRLFERFATGDDSDGFGLGLPLTREIVQLFQGDVDVVSEGAGTAVRLVLPAA